MQHGDTSTGTTTGQTEASFAALIDDAEIVAHLTSQGFQTPTSLQASLIPALRSGRDIVAVGSRGSGKTISYSVYLARELKARGADGSVGIVITATADQARSVVSRLTSFQVPAIGVDASFGGSTSARVLVGPADAVLPACEAGSINPQSVRWVILDEVGDLLSPQTLSMIESTIRMVRGAQDGAQLIYCGKAMTTGIASLVKSWFRDSQQVGGALENSEAGEVTHTYYEVGGDLLAKPNLLADLLSFHAPSSIVIFCNSPSDSDFVEVMLRKRNVEARKLIGNVPGFKVQQSLDDLKAGSIRALILTDVSSKSIEIEDVDILINYSIPSDPEIYIHRLGRSGQGGAKHLIISLVGPLDIANFHYLKKFVEFQFTAGEAPPRENQALSVVRTLEQRAQSSGTPNAENAELIAAILESQHRDAILGMLAQSYLSAGQRGGGRKDRGQEYSAPAGGQDRERGGDRHDRGGRGRGRGRFPRDDEFGGDEERGGQFEGGDSRFAGGAEGDQGSGGRRERRPRREMAPAVRFARLYIGRGSANGFSEDEFRKVASETAGLTTEQLKRFTLRSRYAFVDVAEEAASSTVEKMRDATTSGGDKLLVMRATTVSEPREILPEQSAPRDEENPSAESVEGEDTQQEQFV